MTHLELITSEVKRFSNYFKELPGNVWKLLIPIFARRECETPQKNLRTIGVTVYSNQAASR
jgi:hypothetical protein